MDFSDYTSAAHVLDRLKQVDFVAVVGPSAVGKTTLMTQAAAQFPHITMILTQTSRAPRPGEKDGVDAHFRSKQEMLARIAERGFVQVAPSLFEDIYATAPEDYPSEGVGVLAVLADAVPAFRALPFRSFKVVFIVPPNWERWQQQLGSHGFNQHRFKKRLQEGKQSYQYALQAQDITFVINDDLPTAVADFAAAVSGKPLSPRLQADQTRAKQIIRELLTRL